MNYQKLTRYNLGLFGESHAQSLIYANTGITSIPSFRYHGDLILENRKYVEVKTIRENKDHTFKATINKPNSQHIGKSDFVMLQVIDHENIIYSYIIPVEIIAAKKRIAISSHPITYKGIYSSYLNRFDLLC